MLNFLKAGASPFVAKGLFYGIIAVVIVSLSVGGFLGWKLYRSQEDITRLTEANTQLRSNILTLKANEITLRGEVEVRNQELIDQKRRYESLLLSYEVLENKRDSDQQQARTYKDKLNELAKREENEVLSIKLDDSVIDAYNERMFRQKLQTRP